MTSKATTTIKVSETGAAERATVNPFATTWGQGWKLKYSPANKRHDGTASAKYAQMTDV